MKFWGVFFVILSSFSLAQAQESSSSNAQVSTMATPSRPAGTSKLLLGYKSYNNTGRFGSIKEDSTQASKGITYSGKHEALIGYKHSSDWGGYFQITQYRYEYNNREMNRWSASDPSVSLIHPDWYNDGTLKLGGVVRTYIPNTVRSKNQNIRQYYYGLNLGYKPTGDQDVYSQTIFRNFAAKEYKDADTRFVVENRSAWMKKINSWSKWGAAEWLQIEQHSKTATGYTLEFIPSVDFILNANATIGPRLNLPVFVSGLVYDGPRNATWEEARAEIYFSAAL